MCFFLLIEEEGERAGLGVVECGGVRWRGGGEEGERERGEREGGGGGGGGGRDTEGRIGG